MRIEKEKRMKELERREQERKAIEAEKKRIQKEKEEARKREKEKETNIRDMEMKVYSLKNELKILNENFEIKLQQITKVSQNEIESLIQSRDSQIQEINHNFGSKISNSDAHKKVLTAEIEDQIPAIASKKKRIDDERSRALYLYKYSKGDKNVMNRINSVICMLNNELDGLRCEYHDEIQKMKDERKAIIDSKKYENYSEIKSLEENTKTKINSIHANDEILINQLKQNKNKRSAKIDDEIDNLNKKIIELKNN